MPDCPDGVRRHFLARGATMRLRPRWWIGVAVYLVYAGWVMAAWTFFGIDYASLGTQANLLRAIVLPMGIAALALAAFNTMAQWWPLSISEPRVHKPLFLTLLLLPMAGFISLNFHATGWSAIGAEHVLVLTAAMFLVGFCEEMVTRGVLLVALRGSLTSEAWVWFCSSACFGLLHATNAFFGLGSAALVQVALAFCAGTGLYLLRRLTGSIWLAVGVHALWDFSSLAHGLAPYPTGSAAFLLLASVYALSLVLVVIVLRQSPAPQRLG
jgi:uncharacterized protein